MLVGLYPRKHKMPFVILHRYSMKKLVIALGLLALASCSKKEQARSFKNVAYTIETTVLKDGTTLSVVNNPSFSK